jgi:hypothetical protein
MSLSVKPFLATKLKDLPKYLSSNIGPTSVRNVSPPHHRPIPPLSTLARAGACVQLSHALCSVVGMVVAGGVAWVPAV